MKSSDKDMITEGSSRASLQKRPSVLQRVYPPPPVVSKSLSFGVNSLPESTSTMKSKSTNPFDDLEISEHPISLVALGPDPECIEDYDFIDAEELTEAQSHPDEVEIASQNQASKSWFRLF